MKQAEVEVLHVAEQLATELSAGRLAWKRHETEHQVSFSAQVQIGNKVLVGTGSNVREAFFDLLSRALN